MPTNGTEMTYGFWQNEFTIYKAQAPMFSFNSHDNPGRVILSFSLLYRPGNISERLNHLPEIPPLGNGGGCGPEHQAPDSKSVAISTLCWASS